MKYAGNPYGSEVLGFYYLHENGDLIYKNNYSDGVWADLNESPFVVKFWPFTEFRNNAWDIAVQANALGAYKERIKHLKGHWGLTDEDGLKYCKFSGIRIVKDGDQWCAARLEGFTNIQECNAGFGEDVLTAVSELLKNESQPPQGKELT